MTNHLMTTDDLFFNRTGLDAGKTQDFVTKTLKGADDGELFIEYRQSESLSWDDGKLKGANFDTERGFGLRSVAGEAFGYGHSSELSEAALKRAGETVSSVHRGYSGTMADAPQGTNRFLYTDENPIPLIPFEEKVALMAEIDAYVRASDTRVKQVSVNMAGSWQAVQIIRADGLRVADVRPMVRMNISVVLEENGRMESGFDGYGGRTTLERIIEPTRWKKCANEALRQAKVNLQSIPAPAGEMPVVLGAGWPGILLHEAVGHGLEGDFNRKETSAFSGLMGKKVASEGVTVIDDGTIPDLRGSISVDDEGTPSQKNVLIENGILTGYMQDRMNARLMGVKATGNGRRESHSCPPLPRMTNTFMLGGSATLDDIIASVPRGIYAANFAGGQVDITSGKFVFSAAEAYMIENGKLGAPIKGATIIGNGPDALTRVNMIANDMKMDPGIGTCGKDGQSVPVGVGQPSLRIDGLTVGGTSV